MRRRGFLLVMALLVSLLIAVISLTLLGVRRSGYASSRAVVETAQARELARAGMEDIRVKLAKDPFFPTGIGDEQTLFTFSETVTASDGVKVGTYQVTVDRSLRDTEALMRVQSMGMVGGLQPEGARFTIYAELDLHDFTFKVWQEGVVPVL